VVSGLLGLSTLIGTPAMAQPSDDTSCAPFPERPGAGMAGAIDPPQGNGLRGGKDSDVPYTDDKFPNSPYRDHGHAGMTVVILALNGAEPLVAGDYRTQLWRRDQLSCGGQPGREPETWVCDGGFCQLRRLRARSGTRSSAQNPECRCMGGGAWFRSCATTTGSHAGTSSWSADVQCGPMAGSGSLKRYEPM
jgi:hypothetical protein